MHANCTNIQIYADAATLERISVGCNVINVWNSLPNYVRFASLSTFKKSIRIVDFSELLKDRPSINQLLMTTVTAAFCFVLSSYY